MVKNFCIIGLETMLNISISPIKALSRKALSRNLTNTLSNWNIRLMNINLSKKEYQLMICNLIILHGYKKWQRKIA